MIYQANLQLTLTCKSCAWCHVDKKVGHGDCLTLPLPFAKYYKEGCPKCGSKDFEEGSRQNKGASGLFAQLGKIFGSKS